MKQGGIRQHDAGLKDPEIHLARPQRRERRREDLDRAKNVAHDDQIHQDEEAEYQHVC